MDQLIGWDRDLLLYLNQFHSDGMDSMMLLITKTEFWTPLFLFLIYLLYRNYKARIWIVLLAVSLTIAISDQATSSAMKPAFKRLRPSHEPALEGFVHLATDARGNVYRGGLYGFASSHAANTAGVALFLFLLLGSRYRWISLMFAWALLMSYSRIYLGVHYPGDCLVGIAVGLIAGWAGYRFYLWLDKLVTNKNVLPE